MTIKETYTVAARPGSNRKSKLIVICVCDTCAIEFSYKQTTRALKRTRHYCSPVCYNSSLSNGKARNARETTCIKRYGVVNPYASDIGKQHIKETLIERYGVDNPQRSIEIKKKTLATLLERYQVSSPFQLEHVKESSRNDATKQKRKDTCAKLYGGINFAFELGKHSWTSKIEERFYELLLTAFDDDDIIRQKCVHYEDEHTHKRRWWFIDFYVKSINTYVQLDGVYWHGLDRPIEEIKQSLGARDCRIYKGWHKDRFQDQWFKQHDMTLIRVTDVEAAAL